MRRRSCLQLLSGAAVGLAGCTATALQGGEPATPTPSPVCPSLLDADRTVCPGTTDAALAVERTPERAAGDPWSVAVTVTNRGDAAVRFDPYGWSVYRRADAGWRRVAPDTAGAPTHELAPGEGYVWQLVAAETGLGDADQRVYLDLDPGRYAFAVPFRGPASLEAVAPFRVAG